MMTDAEKLVRDLNDQVKRLEDAQAELDEAEEALYNAVDALIQILDGTEGFAVDGCKYWLSERGFIWRRWPSGMTEVLDDDGWHEVKEPTPEPTP